MRTRVQSRHLLDEKLLVNIWRRSALDECFNDWRRKPLTELGVVSQDDIFFWMNWLKTPYCLIPTLDLEVIGYPGDWRLVLVPEEGENEKEVFVFREGQDFHPPYLFVYKLGEGVTRFCLVTKKNKPVVTEDKLEKVPDWLASKIAIVVEERSPQAASRRLEELKKRLRKLVKPS